MKKKKCPKCQKILLLSEFYSGVNDSWCKNCRKITQTEKRREIYRQKNPEKWAKRNRRRQSIKEGYKFCYDCERILSITLFHKATLNEDGLSNYCKSCKSKRDKKHRGENRERYLKAQRHRSRKYRAERRLKVLTHYGGDPPVCACCDEDIYKFLTIDHIGGGGNAHRREIGTHIYSWLIKNNFPEGFQVLRMNCNLSIGEYGYCPHQKGD